MWILILSANTIIALDVPRDQFVGAHTLVYTLDAAYSYTFKIYILKYA